LAPALIATFVGAASKFSAGETPSGKDIFVRLVTSAAITIAVVFLTGAAAIVALFAFCLYLLSHGGGFPHGP
jgi:predicted small integral membrane protein